MDIRLPYPPTTENAAKLADVFVEAARATSGLEFDFRPESVILAEQQIGDLESSGMPVEALASSLFTMGCYLGEVLVRGLGATWIKTEDSPLHELVPWPIVVRMPTGYCWNPIGRVFKRFELGNSESLVDFVNSIRGKS